MLKTKGIKAAIIKEFGSISECAKALGIDQSTLSRNLKEPSLKTLQKLQDVGVVFDVNIKTLKDNATSIVSGGDTITSNDRTEYLLNRVIQLEAEVERLNKQLKK